MHLWTGHPHVRGATTSSRPDFPAPLRLAGTTAPGSVSEMAAVADGDHEIFMTLRDRQRALLRTQVLDTPPEERFDRITRLAARLLGVPMAMINLIADDHQWTKAQHGIAAGRTPLEDSICRAPVAAGNRLEIPDMSRDERFRDNTFVARDPHVRFYAGEPLAADGVPVGTLCVLDTRPRTLTAEQRELLAELAAWAEAELNNSALNELVARLHEREQRLHRLVEAVPDGVLTVDATGTVRAQNTAARTMFGTTGTDAVPLEELLPGLAGQALPDPDPDGQAVVVRSEIDGRSANGSSFPVETSVARLDGAATERWLVVARDMRAMRTATAELRRQEGLTSRILSSAADGIVGSDRSGVVVFANRAATRILRCRESDLVGRPLHEVAHHSRPDGTPFPAEECPTHRAIGTAESVSVHEDVYWRSDGRAVPVELTVAPLLDGDEHLGAVTTFRDVSERAEVERLKNEFVGVVSHELRTPLTSIAGSLALLANGVMGPVPTALQPMLDMARRNADRLGALVNDILDLDRLDAGRMPLRPAPLDTADLVEQVARALQPAALVAGVELRGVPAAPGEAVVRADADRMAQVLTNLVGNAVKFSAPGQPVTISAARTGSEVHISVRDEGRGIPEEQLEAVFERFRQVEDAAGDRVGTGLGLPIARGIVERSGGRIDVVSAPGRGSTFTVVLPAHLPAPGEASR